MKLKLSVRDIFTIRRMAKRGVSNRTIAAKYSISPGHVSDIITGRYWTDVRSKSDAPIRRPDPDKQHHTRKTSRKKKTSIETARKQLEKVNVKKAVNKVINTNFISVNDLPKKEWEKYTKIALDQIKESTCQFCGTRLCPNCNYCPTHGNITRKETYELAKRLYILGVDSDLLTKAFGLQLVDFLNE